jgi:ATP-binding cassette subfamily B multidrug efflux pump
MLKELKTLLPYLWKYRLYYLAGLLVLVITDSGQLYLPQLVRRAIDSIASGHFEMAGILFLILQMGALALLIAGARFAWRYFIHGASRRIEGELRGRLFDHLQTLSSTFYGRAKTGDLMARFSNDMRAIRMASGMALVAFVDGLFMTVAILAVLLSQNTRLALYSVIPLPVITVGVIFFGRSIGEMFRRVQEGFARLSEMAQESVSGIRVLKTFVRERAFVRKFRELNQEYSRRNMALMRTWGLLFPSVGFLSGLTTLIFLYLGSRAIMEGSLTPGEFTAFFAYLRMLIWPMLGAGFTVNMLQRGAASLGRINRILNEKADIASPARPLKSSLRGGFEFRNLTYAYPGAGEPALDNISFAVEPGGVLGILGKTGSGKSTLVQLLPRILDPPPGTLFVDGRDVRRYDLSVLRSGISVVPQDDFLFSTTLAKNIGFAADDGHDIAQVAAISTIDRDVENFPDGWQTIVGERGITLSGGQKQRVSISRALASPASIYIFDDSFSSVDTETEDQILRSLLPYLAGRTLIIISHRISTLKFADQIIVMERGRISQRGSHETLAAEAGFYSEIFRLQQLAEAIGEGA